MGNTHCMPRFIVSDTPIIEMANCILLHILAAWDEKRKRNILMQMNRNFFLSTWDFTTSTHYMNSFAEYSWKFINELEKSMFSMSRDLCASLRLIKQLFLGSLRGGWVLFVEERLIFLQIWEKIFSYFGLVNIHRGIHCGRNLRRTEGRGRKYYHWQKCWTYAQVCPRIKPIQRWQMT